MILKDLDDKREILRALDLLLKHPRIYKNKKDEIRKEIANIKKGWYVERDNGNYINTYYRDKKNAFVIHDLRIKYRDLGFQIDHLIITNTDIILLESKYFSGYLGYNPTRNEFYLKSNRKYFPIPNPIKQVERQAENLKILMKRLDLNLPWNFSYFVILHPSVRMIGNNFPDEIVKADVFIDRLKDKYKGLLGMMKKFLVVEFGIEKDVKRLLALHKPVDIDFYLKNYNLLWAKDWLMERMEKEYKK